MRLGLNISLALVFAGAALVGPSFAQPAPAITNVPDAFQADLDSAISAHGLDPQRQTFHFVILLNTVRVQEPGDQGLRDIYSHLLKHYLVSASTASDIVSFVPYQLQVRERIAMWNVEFSSSTEVSLLNDLPDQPSASETTGGHDMENALLEALDRVQHPESAVYIVLSDAQTSAVPKNDPGYKLAAQKLNFPQVLAAHHVSLARSNSFQWTVDTPGAPSYEARGWYWIYLPDNLTPLGRLAQTRAQRHAPPAPPPPPPPPLPLPDYRWLWWLAGAAVLTGLVFWLAPRSAHFEVKAGNGPGVVKAVRSGQPVHLSGDDSDRTSVHVEGLPRQRVATVHLRRPAKVCITAEPRFRLGATDDARELSLDTTEQVIVVRESQAGGRAYELHMKTVK